MDFEMTMIVRPSVKSVRSTRPVTLVERLVCTGASP